MEKKIKKSTCWGNSPEYFRQRRQKLGNSLKTKERERWEKRKNTVSVSSRQLARKTGLKTKDIPPELGELQLLINRSNHLIKEKKMAKKRAKKKVDGITALRNLVLETMEAWKKGLVGDDVVKLTNAAASKAIQTTIVQNAYHKRMGYDSQIPFLEN